MQQRGRSAREGSGRWVRVRAALVGVVLLSGFGVVLARAAKVQLFDRARLARLARDQTRREIEWAPRRGPITSTAASAEVPEEMCTTVPPAKSSAPSRCNHPSTPHTQCASGS